jgi:histidinol-phosphate/aromatic aminotransferase/cobyric acid decarboxylase-like protein
VEEIVFGAGAAELIQAVCFTMVRPGDSVLVPMPSFGEYARAAALCGARLLQGIAPPPDYTLDTAAIAEAVVQHRPRLAFLCTPNNPTGQRISHHELRAVADACAAVGTLLVVDQSFDAFLAEPLGTPALPEHPAVIHLRSITKDHALAGVRAAFAVGPAPLVAAVERGRVPWAASTLAQAAATAAMGDDGHAYAALTLPRLRAERERLEAVFATLRVPTVRTFTHFLLAEVGDAAGFAARIHAKHGIRVRDCTSFGLPDHIRVAARTPLDNAELIRALEAECSA